MRHWRSLLIIAVGAVVMASCTTTKSADVSTATTTGPMTPGQVFEQVHLQAVELHGKEGTSDVGGSGFIIDAAKGYVLTNAHVVAGVTALKVRVGDQPETAAKVIASSPCEDVALVQIVSPPPDLQEATLGDSGALKNEDQVVALGFPASFADATTEKVVSTNGSVQSPNVANVKVDDSLPTYASVIQHSATLNPGNSGGPLYDDRGEVVGMNTLTNLGTNQQNVQGQYYSISINHIKQLLPDLEAGKSTANVGWQVVPFSQVYLSDVYDAFGLGTVSEGDDAETTLAAQGVSDGLIIAGVDAGSPAATAKLEPGDLVTAMNGTPVATVSDACDVLESTNTGQAIALNGVYTYQNLAAPTPIFVGDVWQSTMTVQ